jgi:uncharacterized protein YecT (DUF1311 family)
MGRGRKACPIPGARRSASVPSLAAAAISVALAGALAGCGGSGTGASTGSTPAATATATPAATTSGGTTAPAASGFVPIVEPFDPGHPARTGAAPASCGGQGTTTATERCYDAKTENADAEIDAVQLAAYQSASPSQRATILSQDSAWLAARQPVCAKAYQGGGTIDGIDVAACLLDESTARLDAVKGITPPEAMLKATDNTDPSALSWYTTPEGSRIAMVDTQGDNSGGAIIAWVIIAGSAGFVVNPSQFYYSDGSFVDHGVVQPPNPTWHRVAPETEYQFEIDYTHLSADPNASKGTGGYIYVPGTPVAIWQ